MKLVLEHAGWRALVLLLFLTWGIRSGAVLDPRCQLALGAYSHDTTSMSVEELAGPGAKPQDIAQAEEQLADTLRLHFTSTDPEDHLHGAREAFLAAHAIERIDVGGQGVTFVARHRATGARHRYKVSSDADAAEKFAREGEIAELAGRLGVGPRTERIAALNLLKMEEVHGLRLDVFVAEKLSTMAEPARERWIENFTLQLGRKLQLLHAAGVAHLDIKPENILIRDNGEVVIIDYGLALREHEARAVATGRRQGNPYYGSPQYQGRSSLDGRPSIEDDFNSLRLLVEDLLVPPRRPTDRTVERERGRSVPRPIAFRAQMPKFFADRPRLRALFLLLDHPVLRHRSEPDDAASYDRMLGIAMKLEPTNEEQTTFWNAFLSHLRRRPIGVQLQILFGDPALCGPDGILGRIPRAELQNIVERGHAENYENYGKTREIDRLRQYQMGSNDQPYQSGPGRPHRDIDETRLREVQSWFTPPPR